MKEAYRYAKYVSIPLALAGLIWLTGNGLDFLKSYQRVVNYELAYEAPAPFSFELLTPSLRSREDQAFKLKVSTPGEVQPGQVRLVLQGTPIIMDHNADYFEYTFRPPLKTVDFYFEASEVRSRPYTLEVSRVPVIDRFEMHFSYPEYLALEEKRILASGNATVPEGTRIRWILSTVHADSVVYTDPDTTVVKAVQDDETSFDKRIFNVLPYAINASNKEIPEYDKLNYRIDVVRDESPEIKVEMQRDTMSANVVFFGGTVSDDHGLKGLKVVAYPMESEQDSQEIEIPVPQSAFHTFYYTFPSGLDVVDTGEYVVYFEVTDNDGNRGGKTRRSKEFRLKLLDNEELERLKMERQSDILGGMSKSAAQQDELKNELEELIQNQREKEDLSFDDKEKLKRFFEKQEQQERLMEKFSKSLSEGIEERQSPESELLKERLQREEAEAKKNAALMKEMKDILDKLEKGELEERMEELSKSRQNSQRSMEQLLELTKRYYVQEKSRQLGRALSKLAEQQQAQADSEAHMEKKMKDQGELNADFEDLKKQLGELQKDNENLQKPLPWERDEQTEAGVSQDQKEALSTLQDESEKEASGDKESKNGDSGQEKESEKSQEIKKKQNQAAGKLRELSKALSQGAAGGGAETIAEDAEMLRQILDNLVVFSVEQESLFNRIQKGEGDQLGRSADIKKQQQLRQLFSHVDDSLFALSLRRAEISELVNTKITDVYYNTDKALESFGENNWFRGASYQQYVFTAANELSAFLAEFLDNMQDSLMPGKGKGQGSDVQLPDIIKSQQELQEQMQEGGKEEGSKGAEGSKNAGEGGKPEEGEGNPKEQEGNGKGNKEGAEGSDGESEGGKSGGTGKGEGKGKDGRDGEPGESQFEDYYEIYKEQQRIREQLEFQLENMVNDSDRKLGERIALEMELFQNELLQTGITQKTADRLNRIQQQLMRLENATLQQGEDKQRESKAGKKDFTNPVLTPPEVFGRKEGEEEYLNREALPLRRQYRNKVKQYFIGRDSVPFSNRVQS
jgi:hypothetical protein